MRLLVLCPTHRRPIAALAVAESFNRTKILPETHLTFLLYEKDQDSPAYLDSKDTASVNVVLCPERLMVPRVNGALGLLDDYTHVGWIADDNRFGTIGWDRAVLEALGHTPIVFCNDVVSPGSKPSHVFMDSRIPAALGWFLNPNLVSTFQDDVWSTLGVGPDVDTSGPLFGDVAYGMRTGGLGIAYLGGIKVPHLYIQKDNSKDFANDMLAYRHWVRHAAEGDIAKALRALRS